MHPAVRLILVYLALLGASQLLAQFRLADKWRAYADIPAEDLHARGQMLVGIATSYAYSDADSCLLVSELISELATRQDRDDLRGMRAQIDGFVLNQRGQYAESLPVLHRALRLMPRNYDYATNRTHTVHALIDSYNNVRPRQPDSAYYYFTQTIDDNERLGAGRLSWALYERMALVEETGGNWAAAAELIERQIELMETEELRMLGLGYHTAFNFYFRKGDNERYLHYFEKYRERVGGVDFSRSADNYHQLIDIELSPESEMADVARLRKSVDFAFASGVADLGANGLLLLAEYYAQRGRAEEEVAVYQEILARSELVLPPALRLDVLERLYSWHRERNQAAPALTYYERYQSLSDSVYRAENEQNYQRLQVQYETAEKDKALAQQEAALARSRTEIRLSIIGGLTVLLLGIGAFFFQRNRLRYQRRLAAQSQELADNRIATLERDKALVAVNAALEGQEKERMRIAKDLHDSLGGLLMAVKAHFNQLAEASGLRTQQGFGKTNHLIDEACTEVRRISHNMMPQALAVSGIADAFDDLLQRLEAEGLECRLEVIGLREGDLSETQAIMLYRVVQELLQNIQKHAYADRVLLQLIRHQNVCTIILEDDGRGFDLEQARQRGGLGLRSIESRIRYLRGHIDWDAVPDEGTTVSIELPLQPESVATDSPQKTKT